jgi:hypothetical protein
MNVKFQSIAICCLFSNLFFGCFNQTSSPKVLAEVQSKPFDIKQRIDDLKKSGELFDSCQFPYHGNCIYRLCSPRGLQSVSDSTLTEMGNENTSRKLVKYMQVPMIVLNKGKAYFTSNNSFEIYSSVIFMSEYNNETFNEFLLNDVKYSLERGEKVFDKGEFITSDSRLGHTYEFTIVKTHQYLAISYIDLSKYIVMIVLTANDKINYDNNYQNFEHLVTSFKYFGD